MCGYILGKLKQKIRITLAVKRLTFHFSARGACITWTMNCEWCQKAFYFDQVVTYHIEILKMWGVPHLCDLQEHDFTFTSMSSRNLGEFAWAMWVLCMASSTLNFQFINYSRVWNKCGVRLLIFGLLSSGYVLIKGGMFINFLFFFFGYVKVR